MLNSMERIALTVKFGSPDRLPVIPQIFGHAAKLLHVPLRDYCCDGETLARCQLHALDYYQYDAIFAITDVSVEAEALGAKLEYRDHQYPFIRNYALDSLTNLSGIKMPNPRQDGRMPEILKSLRLMRREVGDETLVVGCVLGPTTLAAQLLGMEWALYGAADHPEAFANLLEFCTKAQIAYGNAQLDAGAHMVMIFDPCASMNVVPPQFFREMELPRILEMFNIFKKNGAIASWLNISGRAEGILQYYPQAGVDIASFDYNITSAIVQNLLPQTCVNGNLKSLAFIEEDPEKISQSARQLMQAFSARGGFVLSSGCEIPPEARIDNVKVFVEAAKKEEKIV